MTYEGYEHLIDLVAQGDEEILKAALAEIPAADIAEYIDQNFEVYSALALLDKMPSDQQAEVFGYLRPNNQEELASHMEVGVLAQLFRDMSSDERADVYALLDVKLQDAVMRRLAKREREDLLRLASYEEGTVGAVMTSDYAAIPLAGTVGDALKRLRQSAPEKETIYQTYVVDKDHRLQGVLSLRDILTAAPSETIEEIMTRDVVVLKPDMPQSEAARIISRYDLIAIPVVSDDDILIGMVTFDDAMDVVEEEDTESIHKSATVGRLESGIKDASPFIIYRSRINWLVLLVFANIFSGLGMMYFEDTIATNIALLFFLPLLIASGGNTGAQAATLIVRGMATNDVEKKDWLYMLGKELLVSVGLGVTMAAAISAVAFFRVDPVIIPIVALSMVCIVLVGSLVGVLLPFILKRVGWDPAVASAPLVTTIADAGGVLIYFGIAASFLTLTPPA
ncbi:magnesium transporter [Aliidiomarina haloalkalitolerans]|uniref:Magnesium transporter MgtE n=1 Tax=Aliidiomarina haloalkalitolerans TaxID=859059 RepID=A0A432VRZ1_9GAMM|nr:magnesium transporter [Aliidiomarina haloalkalitolerans]RUO19104.1 magnesium transporter [Aliidiomarina haloalkalitolerans]